MCFHLFSYKNLGKPCTKHTQPRCNCTYYFQKIRKQAYSKHQSLSDGTNQCQTYNLRFSTLQMPELIVKKHFQTSSGVLSEKIVIARFTLKYFRHSQNSHETGLSFDNTSTVLSDKKKSVAKSVWVKFFCFFFGLQHLEKIQEKYIRLSKMCNCISLLLKLAYCMLVKYQIF